MYRSLTLATLLVSTSVMLGGCSTKLKSEEPWIRSPINRVVTRLSGDTWVDALERGEKTIIITGLNLETEWHVLLEDATGKPMPISRISSRAVTLKDGSTQPCLLVTASEKVAKLQVLHLGGSVLVNIPDWNITHVNIDRNRWAIYKWTVGLV